MNVTIRGRVIRGLGEGSRYVELYRDSLRRALGIEPFPGTLNIAVDSGSLDKLRALLKSKPHVVIEPPSREYRSVLAWRARINGYRAYLIKPLASKHPEQVIEFIADVNLRECLRIQNGSEVTIDAEIELSSSTI
ncbi:MAG: CTP-dependent riboflavin kinase [Sulfolobales archaeon]|nr:CTP-dependent riboflavin kinase [Sulfolobales archaeon]MCX8199426.1 CTP-dependent riboflavin kinase [Sulfolobales archaeon]MDW8170259.1 DUF120 domain-containing protein [Desulfurococcaceae archaeon]